MGDANLSEGEQSDVSLVAAGVRYLADIAHYERKLIAKIAQ